MSQPVQQQPLEPPSASPPSQPRLLEEVAEATVLRFSDEQRSIMRESYCQGASESEFRQLCAIAEARGLNPLAGQCHFVERWNSQQRKMVWAVQISIDGMRSVAEASGRYDGQEEPEFEHDPDGFPVLARVKVYRKDWHRPAVGVAHYDEYVVNSKDGKPNHMWAEKPHIMLSKCAEALALRKAFPQRLGGLYVPEEVERGQAERPVSRPRQPAPPSGTPLSEAAQEWIARIHNVDTLDAIDELSARFQKSRPRMPSTDRERVRAAGMRRRAELQAAADDRGTDEPYEPKAEELSDDGRPTREPGEEG